MQIIKKKHVTLICFCLSFSPTLYVGEYEHGFYAVGSLVDEKTVAVAVSVLILGFPWLIFFL